MAKLTGTNPDQVPTNADLGTMAYQDKDNLQVGSVYANGILRSDQGAGHIIVKHDGSNGSISNNTGQLLVYAEGSGDIINHTNGVERMRIDNSGNVGINTNNPDSYATSSKLLHIAGTASNSGPAGFMMTGQAASQGQAFYSQEVFQINFGGSATEFCRFTGTGANGYQAYFKIIVTGHEGTQGNGTTIKEYIWGGGTNSPTQLSTTTNGQAPVISFDNSTSNVCIIKLASANGNGFNGVMKVEWMNPLDFASSTFTVS
jgi:hypothetical protein